MICPLGDSNFSAADATRAQSVPLSLNMVEWDRRSPVLTHPGLPCLSSFHTLSLTAGCPSECRYCYVERDSHYPGGETVSYYSNLLACLREELPRLREPPRVVYFSSSGEPFLAVDRILDDLYDIMKLLLDSGSELLITTLGVVQPRFAELFTRYPGKVHVQIGMTTINDAIRQVIEPRAASVEQRLGNLDLLLGSGVDTEVRMDPLIPGLTDTPESLNPFLAELARRGVKRAVASFLFQRKGVSLPPDLAWGDWTVREMKKYYTLKITDYCGKGTIWLPPALYRRARYNEIKAQAALCGIGIRLCHCKNSDLTEECCHAALPPEENFQMTLF